MSVRGATRSRRARSTSRACFSPRTSDQGIFAYLASRQTVRQREFETIAVRNQVFLQVTWAYSELLRAEGRRAAQIQARDEARRDRQAHGRLCQDRPRP